VAVSMPELPEVERARCLAEEHLVGKQVAQLQWQEDDKVLDWEGGLERIRQLEGQRVVASKRKGKHMWLEFDVSECPCLAFHFGMTGSLEVRGKGAMMYKSFKTDADNWPPRFWKLIVTTDDGTEMAFTDSRRFGRIRLLNDPLACNPIGALGFDPLLDMMALEPFCDHLRSKGAPIKAALLDQSFVAGVGNWVADEVLYQARVHPEVRSSKLSDTQLGRIHSALGNVIHTACACNADASRFPPSWLFHYRWTGKRSSSIDGRAISFVTVGGRTSAFVPSLQLKTDPNTPPTASGSDVIASAKATPVRQVSKKASQKLRQTGGLLVDKKATAKRQAGGPALPGARRSPRLSGSNEFARFQISPQALGL